MRVSSFRSANLDPKGLRILAFAIITSLFFVEVLKEAALSQENILLTRELTQQTDQANRTVYVEIKSAGLREEPKHWSPVLANLNFGEPLELDLGDSTMPQFPDDAVIGRGGWVKVKVKSGQHGFVHRSAITFNPVVFSGSGAEALQVSSERDIVLAGKGFGRDIEKMYILQKSGQLIDYGTIDQLENIRVSNSTLQKFSDEGGFVMPDQL